MGTLVVIDGRKGIRTPDPVLAKRNELLVTSCYESARFVINAAMTDVASSCELLRLTTDNRVK
jgi:hypothetical protein